MKNTINGRGILKGILFSLLAILVVFSVIGSILFIRLSSRLNTESIAFRDLKATVNVLPNQIYTQVYGVINQQNQQLSSLANTLSSMKASLDSANAKIADLQKQEDAKQAAINQLQTAINSLQIRAQQYSYPYPYFYQDGYPYPYYPSSPLLVSIQNNSGVLALTTKVWDSGVRWYTTTSLAGFATLTITNTAGYDINNAILTIDFHLVGIPSIQDSNPQLSGGNISWTLIVANPNELKFQTGQFGITVGAGQSLSIPLTLSASCLGNFGWQQSYSFQVVATVNQ